MTEYLPCPDCDEPAIPPYVPTFQAALSSSEEPPASDPSDGAKGGDGT